MPGEPQHKAVSHHDVKSLLPTHSWDQLLSLQQTFSGRVVLEGCSAPDLWLSHPPWQAGSVKAKWQQQLEHCCHKLPMLTPCWAESAIAGVGIIKKALFPHSTVRKNLFETD